MPLSTGKGGYSEALNILQSMGLDGMEVEFVHGVRMTDETRKFLKETAKEKKKLKQVYKELLILQMPQMILEVTVSHTMQLSIWGKTKKLFLNKLKLKLKKLLKY